MNMTNGDMGMMIGGPPPPLGGLASGRGEIVLIGNDTDILHSGYSHAISDQGKRFPSVHHYAHSQILSQLGVAEDALHDLLCVTTKDVAMKARELLVQNMPTGHDLNSLATYLSSSRQSYTMQGLRLRIGQDKAFEQALMATHEHLLIVCDAKDRELGIGMEEASFAEWMGRERCDATQIAYWMKNEIGRPAHLGQNQLGYFLMWLRHEVREKKKVAMLSCRPREVEGLSKDQNDLPVKLQVNDLVIALTGVFRPLSNYYPMRFEMKGETYRSVEHYAYEKLFYSLKLDDKAIEKITTTVLPVDVPVMARRLFKKLELAEPALESKMAKLDRWRQSAMKHKLSNNEYLQQLLLSTGDALLIDNADGDPAWTCGGSEASLQEQMGMGRLTAEKCVGAMRGKMGGKDETVPKSLSYLTGNKTGLLLMELRTRLAGQTTSRIPLISSLDMSLLSSQVSPHVICLTAESVWHPLYPAEIAPAPGAPLLPSPAHYVAQQAIKWYGLNAPDAEWIMEERSSIVCWQRLHWVLESRASELEKDTQWWMTKRQTAIREALTLLLEQHPPLLRALLDTQDAMLVYCCRFSSTEAELSMGMRECDLRAWMQYVDVDTKQLIELCNRPLAFRPPYLGGNRLGLILMELRREFVLRGIFPHTLPPLDIGADAILGSDSPTESYLVGEHFDVMAKENFASTFINPLILLARETKDPELAEASRRTKATPRLVSMDDERIGTIVDDLDAMAGKVDDTYLSECSPEELRAVFLRMMIRIRGKICECERQQNSMNVCARDTQQIQYLRRQVEDAAENRRPINAQEPIPLLSLPLSRSNTRDGKQGGPGGGPHIGGGPNRPRAAGGRDDGLRFGHGGGMGNNNSMDNGRNQQQRRRSPDRGPRTIRGDLIPPKMPMGGGGGLGPGRGPPQRMQQQQQQYDRRPGGPPFGPPPGRGYENNGPDAKRGRMGESQSPATPRKALFPPSNVPPTVAAAPPPKEAPPPKPKAPRPADEELSDGEILDSDED